MNKLIVRWHTAMLSLKDSADRGAVAAEYGILIAGIVIVVIAGVFLLGSRLGDLFNDVADTIPTTAPGS
jgi:Flp pilus assembly pilin Flp